MKLGPENHNWKGGKSVASSGYVLVRVGKDHHLSDVRGYAYEHRLVAEEKLGRRLKTGEQIHHVNGKKADNRPENIQVMATAAHHLNQHRKLDSNRRLAGEANPMALCACGCGKWFSRYDESGRPRKYISGHNPHDLGRQERFLAAVRDGSGTAQDIARRTGQSEGAVKTMASKLVREGKLNRIGRGIYGSPN